jgi:hypothetical protein
MLPKLGVPLSADDPWGARCGLLHTVTAESDMSHNLCRAREDYVNSIIAPYSDCRECQR